jgi:predicted SAM-dependent methyltransferase
LDRREFLLQRIDRSMNLVEIGPSHRPLAAKRDGWRTTVVDHDTRAGIVEKYANNPVVIADNIEEVDVVWSGGDLAANFPPASLGTFDAILASHVLEHMPDPITFLQSAQRLLKPTGAVMLALPDKRYTFDFFGPLTATGDWLTAHGVTARTHSKRAAFNHVAYAVTNDGKITWTHEQKLDSLRFAHHLEQGAGHFDGNTDSGQGAKYIDYHAWRFTPSSFMLLILEISQIRDVDFHTAACTPAKGHEFFVVLRRGRHVFADAEALNAKRLDLLRATIHEQRHATDLLLGIL